MESLKCKFWYSAKHDECLDEFRSVEMYGQEVPFTATSSPEAGEPFPDAFRLWPDYKPLGVASIETIKVIPGRKPNDREVDAKGKIPGWGWTDAWENNKKTIKTLGYLTILCIVGYAIYGGYGWLDSIGWISHQEETVITARSDWLVGESKECWSATLGSDGAALAGKKVGYAMPAVSCDDGPEHKMTITFYGRVEQPDHNLVKWRCTKGMISFTCYQTGGEH
jgi:hypothetical protein